MGLAILKNLSVIVPFTGQDLLWKDLLQDLKPLPKDAEILLVGPEAPEASILKKASEAVIATIRYIPSRQGRGVQLNTGAKNANGQFLWFLHADSKVPRPALFNLAKELQEKPAALHFFHLHFLSDGPKLVGLNSIVTNLRSRYLGLPLGEQGFVISKPQFFRMGGYSENLEHGEDQVLVWKALQQQIPLNMIPAALFTSARRFEYEGWGSLTRQRALRFFILATAESIKFCKIKASQSFSKKLKEKFWLTGSS